MILSIRAKVEENFIAGVWTYACNTFYTGGRYLFSTYHVFGQTFFPSTVLFIDRLSSIFGSIRKPPQENDQFCFTVGPIGSYSCYRIFDIQRRESVIVFGHMAPGVSTIVERNAARDSTSTFRITPFTTLVISASKSVLHQEQSNFLKSLNSTKTGHNLINSNLAFPLRCNQASPDPQSSENSTQTTSNLTPAHACPNLRGR